jgi:DNA-binding response OmpR family regulator
MLTARTTEADKLAGLENGADDYVTKPFSPRELVARVKAVLRRSRGGDNNESEIISGDLAIDLVHQEVRVRGELVNLTPKEFSLLRVLSREPGRPFSRVGLMERAFGFDYDGLERTVDAHVANLRKKIEADPAHPRYVLTVQGVGYKFGMQGEP